MNYIFNYSQPGQWHWLKYINPSSQPCWIFNPSTGSEREEDIAIAMSWFSSFEIVSTINLSNFIHNHHLKIKIKYRDWEINLVCLSYVFVCFLHRDAWNARPIVDSCSGFVGIISFHDQNILNWIPYLLNFDLKAILEYLIWKI